MGRPKKDIDPKVVERLARIHCTHEEIASVVDCSTDTLTRRFADLIKKGRAEGKVSLRRQQWKKALDGDKTMLIWLGKNELGQTDKSEHTGKDGGPLTLVDVILEHTNGNGSATE